MDVAVAITIFVAGFGVAIQLVNVVIHLLTLLNQKK